MKKIVTLAILGAAFGTFAAEPISYLDWDAENRVMTNAVCTAYTVVTAETATFDSGWYVVTNEVYDIIRDVVKASDDVLQMHSLFNN